MRLEEIFKFGRRKNDAALARLNEIIRTFNKEGLLKGIKEVPKEDFNRGVAQTFVDSEKVYLNKRSKVRANSPENIDRALLPIKKAFARTLQRILKLIGP